MTHTPDQPSLLWSLCSVALIGIGISSAYVVAVVLAGGVY